MERFSFEMPQPVPEDDESGTDTKRRATREGEDSVSPEATPESLEEQRDINQVKELFERSSETFDPDSRRELFQQAWEQLQQLAEAYGVTIEHGRTEEDNDIYLISGTTGDLFELLSGGSVEIVGDTSEGEHTPNALTNTEAGYELADESVRHDHKPRIIIGARTDAVSVVEPPDTYDAGTEAETAALRSASGTLSRENTAFVDVVVPRYLFEEPSAAEEGSDEDDQELNYSPEPYRIRWNYSEIDSADEST
jgi:hypothetical protein